MSLHDCDHYLTPYSRWWKSIVRKHEPTLILADDTISPKACLLVGVAAFTISSLLRVVIDLWLFFEGVTESALTGLTVVTIVTGIASGLVTIFVMDTRRHIYRRWRLMQRGFNVAHRKFGRSKCEGVPRLDLRILETRWVMAESGHTGNARFLAAHSIDPNAWILLHLEYDDPAAEQPTPLQKLFETPVLPRKLRTHEQITDRTLAVLDALGAIPAETREEPLRLGVFNGPRSN